MGNGYTHMLRGEFANVYERLLVDRQEMTGSEKTDKYTHVHKKKLEKGRTREKDAEATVTIYNVLVITFKKLHCVKPLLKHIPVRCEDVTAEGSYSLHCNGMMFYIYY